MAATLHLNNHCSLQGCSLADARFSFLDEHAPAAPALEGAGLKPHRTVPPVTSGKSVTMPLAVWCRCQGSLKVNLQACLYQSPRDSLACASFSHHVLLVRLNTLAVLVQVAIKFLERGPGISKSVLREILNHRLCVVHPNIVQFKEVCCSGCRPGFSHKMPPC